MPLRGSAGEVEEAVGAECSLLEHPPPTLRRGTVSQFSNCKTLTCTFTSHGRQGQHQL